MTYEEAKKILKAFIEINGCIELPIVINAIKKAIEALEMRTPKKAYDVNREMKSFDCPSCLSSLYAEDELENVGYCCVCGQAIDWSADEET
ncbi:MAG: hypothetical protein KBT02_10295 [Treponema sp.]|nr:hypothetical protein [Candidatus Treponema caballi]